MSKREILNNLFGLNDVINIDLFSDKIDELNKYLKCWNENTSWNKCHNYINVIYNADMLDYIKFNNVNNEVKFNFLLYFIYKFFDLNFKETIDLGDGQRMFYNASGDLESNRYKVRTIFDTLKILTFHFQYYIDKEIEKLPGLTTLKDNVKTTFEEFPFYIAIHIAKGIIQEYVNILIYYNYETRLMFYKTLHDIFYKYHIDSLDMDVELFNIKKLGPCGLEYYFPVLNIPFVKDMFDKYLDEVIKCWDIYDNKFRINNFMLNISANLSLYQFEHK